MAHKAVTETTEMATGEHPDGFTGEIIAKAFGVDQHPMWDRIALATTPEDRRKAAAYAIEEVHSPKYGGRVPRFILDLPGGQGDDVLTDAFMMDRLMSEDGNVSEDDSNVFSAADVINELLVIKDVRVNSSDVEGSRWPVYLSLGALRSGGEEIVVNTGSPQVMVVIWRKYCEMGLPITGTIIPLGREVRGRNRALGFVTESAF